MFDSEPEEEGDNGVRDNWEDFEDDDASVFSASTTTTKKEDELDFDAETNPSPSPSKPKDNLKFPPITQDVSILAKQFTVKDKDIENAPLHQKDKDNATISEPLLLVNFTRLSQGEITFLVETNQVSNLRLLEQYKV